MNYLEVENFFFELPLYTSVDILPEQLDNFKNLASFRGKINGYNPFINEPTTFSVDIDSLYDEKFNDPSYFLKTTKATLKCLRTNIIFEYYFKTYKKHKSIFYSVKKIGQDPSIADLHINQIKKYDKVLTKEKLKEFTKAIGLAANGVGIGSFVYLRRIFEYLIEEAHVKLKATDYWNEETYQKLRMAEKIESLKSELPDFLVEHKQLYGILSKGIHELTEDICLSHFTPVRVGIEMILDDKLIELEKHERRLKASNAIKGIVNEIKK